LEHLQVPKSSVKLKIQQHPSGLQAATIKKSWCTTAGLWKTQGMQSENTYNFPIIDRFRHYRWKAIAPEASNTGTSELRLEV